MVDRNKRDGAPEFFYWCVRKRMFPKCAIRRALDSTFEKHTITSSLVILS